MKVNLIKKRVNYENSLLLKVDEINTVLRVKGKGIKTFY